MRASNAPNVRLQGPSVMRSPFPASPDDIDLVALGTAVRRVLPKLLVATLLVGLASFVALSMLTPKYASQAQIEIISKGLGNPFEPRRDSSTPELVSVRDRRTSIVSSNRGRTRSASRSMRTPPLAGMAER